MSHEIQCPNCRSSEGPNSREQPQYINCTNCGERYFNYDYEEDDGYLDPEPIVEKKSEPEPKVVFEDLDLDLMSEIYLKIFERVLTFDALKKNPRSKRTKESLDALRSLIIDPLSPIRKWKLINNRGESIRSTNKKNYNAEYPFLISKKYGLIEEFKIGRVKYYRISENENFKSYLNMVFNTLEEEDHPNRKSLMLDIFNIVVKNNNEIKNLKKLIFEIL